MIKKLKYYFIPLNPNLDFISKFPELSNDIMKITDFISRLNFESVGEHPQYGQIGIKPTLVHTNFESNEVADTMRCVALFEDDSIFESNFYIVDVNTNVFLNRYITEDYKANSEGELIDACIGVLVTEKESVDNYKVISLPDEANSVTKVQLESGMRMDSESFFDSALKKVYLLSPLNAGERVTVCYSSDVLDDVQVENIAGFDMGRLLVHTGQNQMIEEAKKKGKRLIPFGRWILFAIRLWLYLQLPSIVGPFIKRGPAWKSGELADVIVDYYKQTVMGAFNIWANLPDRNPGEQGMRRVLKAAFLMLYLSGGSKDLAKLADPLIKLSVMVFWFGATLKKIPPPGSIQNVISPVVFLGIPFVTAPTPSTDSTQMAREFAFMFAIHSLTLVGFEIGMVPVGTGAIPVPYPFVALI